MDGVEHGFGYGLCLVDDSLYNLLVGWKDGRYRTLKDVRIEISELLSYHRIPARDQQHVMSSSWEPGPETQTQVEGPESDE